MSTTQQRPHQFPEKKLARQVKLHLCHRYIGMKLREIWLRFDIGQSGITQASHRIALKTGKDEKLRKIVKRIEKMLLLSNV